MQIEPQAASIRARWMPLFRKHHVRLLLTGHEHLFEHWVERYVDASGTHRIDEIVSGGGGAPLYGYMGEPDLRDYLATGAADSVTLEHLVRPPSIRAPIRSTTWSCTWTARGSRSRSSPPTGAGDSPPIARAARR